MKKYFFCIFFFYSVSLFPQNKVNILKPQYTQQELESMAILKVQGVYKLNAISKILNEDIVRLKRWNPGFDENVLHATSPIHLRIPLNKLEKFIIYKDEILAESIKLRSSAKSDNDSIYTIIIRDTSRIRRIKINGTEFVSTKSKELEELPIHNLNNIIIKLKKKSSGTYFIPCKINGLYMEFIFDTGASDVSISLTEASFMLKNGYLKSEDILGKAYYQIANGNIETGTKINIRKIEIQGMLFYNVNASIVHDLDAPLLMGQSLLKKMGKIQIDYINNTLTIIK